MKLKEIPRTATFAWSPDPVVPTIVTGTAAGTIDADFSAATELELWNLDLLDHSVASFSATPAARAETDARFHDIAVSGDGEVAVGALENGVVEAWSLPSLKSVARNDSAHTGAVKSVAFSAKEPTKFATGGAQGQVFVWNVQNMSAPFAPGTAAAQRHDDVESVSWNNAAAQILASGGNKGFASIWDTRRKREVLHLHYASPTTGSRVPISSVQWHPTNSTKLATASVDDNEPVICIWDLKNVNSPERVLRGHTKGVLSLDWCQQDENLLLSGGRDNATLLWNPQSGEQLGTYPISVEWAFKTKFNQRMPDLFASASFDGKISVQTLQDAGAGAATGTSEADKASDGADFWERDTVMDTVHPSFKLQQPPKWLGRPISASFGFGGKLVVTKKNKVSVHSVTDSVLDSEETKSLSSALKSRNFEELANTKSQSASWELLSTLLKGESLPIPEEPLNTNSTSSKDDDEDEFDIVSPFVPSSDFQLLDSKHPSVVAAVLANDFDSAVSQLIANGQAGDALLIASFGGPDLVTRAQNAYLNAHASEQPYLRAAWAVATKSPQDIVEHAELKAWPAVLRSVLAEDDAAAKKQATHRLGRRLLDASERDNALKTFLAGGNVGAAASLWLDELPALEKKIVKDEKTTAYVAHVRALQHVVEQIAAATSKLGLPPMTDPGAERLYSAFRDYADLAAQQGDLELAKLLLDNLPEDYAADKQRVQVATQQQQVGGRHRQAPVASPSIPSPGIPSSAPGATPRAAPQQAPSPLGTPGQPAGATRPAATRTSATRSGPVRSGVSSPSASPYAANPYAPAGVSPAAASVAASNAAAHASPAPASSQAPPPPPPVSGSSGAPATPSAPFKGWNDIPELPSGARRTPVAPKRVAPPKAAATVAPPSASASPRGSVASIPPPPSAAFPGAASPAAPAAHPVAGHAVAPAPPPATSRVSNPYAPKSGSNPTSRASSVSGKPNPYAPSPSSTPPSTQSPVPRPNVAAPPPRVRAAAPPPPAASAISPPPPAANVVSPPPVASPVASAPPAAAAPGKHAKKVAPEQLPDNLKPIYSGFEAEMRRVQPIIEAQYAKQYHDTVRRLNILYDQLPVLSDELVAALLEVASMISNRDYTTINDKVQSIATTHSGETGEWFTGVKRLVKMSEGVPV